MRTTSFAIAAYLLAGNAATALPTGGTAVETGMLPRLQVMIDSLPSARYRANAACILLTNMLGTAALDAEQARDTTRRIGPCIPSFWLQPTGIK